MKSEEKIEARQLRAEGGAIHEIARKLGVAKSTVFLWTKDLPQPQRLTTEARRQRKIKRLRHLADERKHRKRERLARIVISGDCGRPLIRTPHGYGGSTLINGRYVYAHRLVAEEMIGRLLRPGEVVHHRNTDIFDNRPENLEVKTNGQHVREHKSGKKIITLVCPTCKKLFERPTRVYKWRRQHLGQKQFFCSRKCKQEVRGSNPLAPTNYDYALWGNGNPRDFESLAPGPTPGRATINKNGPSFNGRTHGSEP